MLTFLALFRGRTVTDAQVIAVTTDHSLISDVATHLLRDAEDCSDAVLLARQRAEYDALRLILMESETGSGEVRHAGV
jgi:hypothetical protein